MKAWVGIDPGQKGAISIIDEDGVVDVLQMPLITGFIDAMEVRHFLGNWRHCDYSRYVAIEKVHSMPKQSSQSTFTFGRGYGPVDNHPSVARTPLGRSSVGRV